MGLSQKLIYFRLEVTTSRSIKKRLNKHNPSREVYFPNGWDSFCRMVATFALHFHAAGIIVIMRKRKRYHRGANAIEVENDQDISQFHAIVHLYLAHSQHIRLYFVSNIRAAGRVERD
jgi:hypothetical protein